MIALSVNLNKIALIRNSRDTTNSNVTEHGNGMLTDNGTNLMWANARRGRPTRIARRIAPKPSV